MNSESEPGHRADREAVGGKLCRYKAIFADSISLSLSLWVSVGCGASRNSSARKSPTGAEQWSNRERYMAPF